ncbi:Fc.00g088690.m01.CDS01 [Cosmosporella sp. VM-42]
MGATFSQVFPPKPTFTEKDLPDLTGRVYFITGPTSCIGLHLAILLYSRSATIFLAARSASKLASAVDQIKTSCPSSKGHLHSLSLDLCSYPSIKAAASEFLSKSDRLDVLFHNAGILAPPKGSKTGHDVELQMGVHCVGPYFLTKLLEQRLKETAKLPSVGLGETRIVWTGSAGAMLSPQGGVNVEELKNGKFSDLGPITRYNTSKAGEYFLSGKYSKALREYGILSVFLDPGNIKTDLQRTFSTEVSWIGSFVLSLFLHAPVKGAYTELFSGLFPDVNLDTMKNLGVWIVPFGRIRHVRDDLVIACEAAIEKGEGQVAEFFVWCDEQLKGFL